MANKTTFVSRRQRVEEKNNTFIDKVNAVAAKVTPRVVPIILASLIVLFIVSLLFFQAAFALNDSRKAVADSRAELKQSIEETGNALTVLDLQNADTRAQALAMLNDTSEKAKALSEECKKHAPIVGPLARDYKAVSAECNDFSASASALGDSLADMKNIAEYEFALASAMAPAFEYQYGPDRTQPHQGFEAWKKTLEQLQAVTPHQNLKTMHNSLTATSGDIAKTLGDIHMAEKAGDKDSYNQLNDKMIILYTQINGLSDSVRAELVRAQNQVSSSAKEVTKN
ncbi:hypothetical protein CYG49_00775 [Candidatus Saccharibacteria bacterium]|nr:MAG: hypothetical protein CYG49_00775 [Candidatus Saccharibacteria bacterium]